MASPEGGTASYVTNKEVAEAIPVAVVSGTVDITVGDVGLVNKANADIDPATEDKQDDAIALLTAMDADTSKIPALGTAAMAASAPVTIATNDTMMTALDAAVDLINTNLGTIETDVEAVETTLTNLEKVLMGNAAPVVDSYDSAVVDCAIGANAVIAAPGEGKALWIYGLLGTADTVDTTILLLSGATAKSGTMPMADNGGFGMEPSGNFAMPWIKCAANEAFNITTATGTFDGIVTYAVITV